MPKLEHERQEDQVFNQSQTAQQQATREAGRQQARDPSQEIAKLRDKVADMQQRAVNGYPQERENLEQQQQAKRQELAKVQAVEKPEVANAHPAERQTEVNTLNQFQDNQRQAVEQRQQLEQQVFQEQARAVQDLQTRQQNEIQHLQGRINQTAPDAQASLNSERQQLDERQQLERQQLEQQFKNQVQVLQDLRDGLKNQMNQDQGRLQQALYEKGPGAEQQQALANVLKQQEETTQEKLRNTEQRLFSLYAQRAFANNFSETQALKELWERAADGYSTAEFAGARSNFWKEVNNAKDATSETVRRIIKEAGYELQAGSNAPLLSMKGWDHARPSRETANRRLSVDHANPQSKAHDKALDSTNLRFMSTSDNSARGAHFNEFDHRPDKDK